MNRRTFLAAAAGALVVRPAPSEDPQPHKLTIAAERIAAQFLKTNRREQNYRFDLALEALLEMCEATKKPDYREHVLKVVRERGWTSQTDVSFRGQSFVCVTYALYVHTGEKGWLDVFLKQSDLCRKGQERSPEGAVMHARGKERGGGFAMLLDSTQEYIARMARAGKHTGDASYYREAAEQVKLYREIVRDEKTGLWHQGRGWLRDQPKEISPGFWSRGHGWWSRGLVTALANIPPERDEFKQIQQTFREMADSLLARQQPSGMWHCLLDRDPSASPPESSGTAMIATSLSRAVRLGVMKDEKYRDAARKAFAALVEYVDADGSVLSTSPGPGPLESEANYLTKSFLPGNDHGTFALMFAGAEAGRP